MKNYIVINGGKPIELTPEQVKTIKQSLCTNERLKNLSVGETFKIMDGEFVVLEQSGDTTAVITKELIKECTKFGENNNFADGGNVIREVLAKFQREIEDIIGRDNLVEHTVDLTSDDGLKDYGSTKAKMSLLTCEQYRKYVDVLDKHKLKKWWWLATPYSTPSHEDVDYVKCVSPFGYVDGICFNFNFIGVRPFCILNSNIFVSK